MKVLHNKFVALAMATTFLSTPVLAQESPPENPDASASVDQTGDDDYGLNVIIVTAQKKAERLSDVPVSVGVVAGENLERLNIGTFEQMARYVPTFNVSETASGNRITLRGISSGTNRGFEQSVGLFVDGIYGGRAAQFSSPFFDVERVEVLKGPQSILFGKNTVAGAVSVITNKPSRDLEIDLAGGYETRFGGWDMAGILNVPVSDTLQVRAAYKHEERDNGFLRNSLTGGREQSKLTDVARFSLAWEPGNDITVNAKYEYSRLKKVGNAFQLITAGKYLPLFQLFDPKTETDLDLHNSMGSGQPGNGLNEIEAHNALVHVAVPLGNATLTSDTGYSAFSGKVQGEDSDMTPVPVIAFDNNEKFWQFSQELRFASDPLDQLAYTVGAYFQKNNYHGLPDFHVSAQALGLFNVGSHRDFDQDADTWSAFGELSYELSPGLRLIGGLRYIKEKKQVDRSLVVMNYATWTPETDPVILARTASILGSQNFSLSERLTENQWTPAATLQYKPNADTMLYLKYGKGFKGGGFDASDTMGTAVPFRSEKVTTYEGGFKWSASRFFSLNGSVFHSQFSDLQVQALQGLTFITTNAAKAKAQGFELEARWRPSRPLTLSGTLSYLDAKFSSYANATCTTDQSASWTGAGRCVQDLSGRPLTDAPRWSSSVNASYDLALGDWMLTANAGANYRSATYVAPDLDPLGLQKAYATVDSSLTLASPDDRYSLTLLAKNLTDERAKSYVVNAVFFSGAKAAAIIEPRTIELRAAMKF